MRTALISLMSFGLAWIMPQMTGLQSSQAIDTSAATVQEFLGLSNEQQQRLEELSKTLREKAGAQMQDLETKQKALRMRLASDDKDALAAGKALLELEVARRRSEQTSEALRVEAMSILTHEQREKLKALEEAEKLHPVARQAMGMFLISPPAAVITGAGPFGMFKAKPYGLRGNRPASST